MNKKQPLENCLNRYRGQFNFVMRFDPSNDRVCVIDLTASNKDLSEVNIDDEQSFTSYIFNAIKDAGAIYGAGGYRKNRIVYSRSEVFEGDRSVHLGVDLWAPAGEKVFSPLDGVIHSFQDNNSHGDYGPTIILRHELDGISFHTLYGHLSKNSLVHKKPGQKVNKGECIGFLGEYEENVHWPPHLHFQVINDLMGRQGDYPGVARPSESEKYLDNCPDPNLILGIRALNDNNIGAPD